jgi:hypothetical protein
LEDLHGHLARHFAGGVTAHSVRDDEDAAGSIGIDREVILVAGPDHANIRPRCVEKPHARPLSRMNATAAITRTPTIQAQPRMPPVGAGSVMA